MTTLTEWATRHNVSQIAVDDLIALIKNDSPNTDPNATDKNLEAHVQQAVRLEATRAGCRLWRNNVGACTTSEGSFIRFGLCNDSKRMNTEIKSSDLVGIRPVIIKPKYVGRVFGLFLARETKKPGWKFKGTARERAQLKYLELVLAMGGDACFVTGEGTL